VFFENTGLHSGPCQQVTQHYPSWPSTGDATPGCLCHPLPNEILMVLAARMSTAAEYVGRFSFALAVGTAIVAVGFGVAMATGMCALLWLVHGL
jgi:hypothetical protein